MMEDNDTIAEVCARQIAQISNFSALNATIILTPEQRHKILLTKLLTSNQSTLDNFVLRLNQDASANYRKPFTKENFKNLFIGFHIANNLPFSFVENNKTLQNLLNFGILTEQTPDLRVVKLPSRQTLTPFNIDEYNL